MISHGRICLHGSSFGRRLVGLIGLVSLGLGGPARAVAAQSLLERSPDMTGTWVGQTGTVYFDFSHRFASTGGNVEKVVNSPTFLLGIPLPGQTMVGARYATNSVLVPGFPNEWEFFGRYAPLRQSAGAPLDVTVHGAYNQAARSWDGELAVARAFGPLRLIAAGREFSSYARSGDARWAVAGGATLKLHRFVAISGDVASLTDRADGEEVAWGAGLQLEIPYTPHTLSVQVSNTTTTTLEGASLGTVSGHRWGFEFIVPFTLSRYFGGRSRSAADDTGLSSPSGDYAAEVTMSNQLRFSPATVHIKVGDTVHWKNVSDLVHTVTADPKLAAKASDVHLPDGADPFNSGDLKPGQEFTHTFTVPGEYMYFCQPHELAGMVAKVIVEKKGGES